MLCCKSSCYNLNPEHNGMDIIQEFISVAPYATLTISLSCILFNSFILTLSLQVVEMQNLRCEN